MGKFRIDRWRSAVAGHQPAVEDFGVFALDTAMATALFYFKGLSAEEYQDLRSQGAMAVLGAMATYDPTRAGLSAYFGRVALNAMRDWRSHENLVARNIMAMADNPHRCISAGHDYDEFIDRVTRAAIAEFGPKSKEVAVLSLRWAGYSLADVYARLGETQWGLIPVVERLRQWATANRYLFLPMSSLPL